MRKFTKGFIGGVTAASVILLVLTFYLRLTLPDRYYIIYGDTLHIPSRFSGLVSKNSDADLNNKYEGKEYTASLRLLDTIPVKEVSVQVTPRRMVVPGGTPFGIKMFTDGVMVVGKSDIKVGMESVNPSKIAGIKIGDMIVEVNGQPASRISDVMRPILNSDGSDIHLRVNRAGEELDFTLTPVQTEYDGTFKAGLWVRDSSAGIGTLTFYNPSTLAFAGLGHAVCDVDTGRIMPLARGEIVDVNISGSNVGLSGRPGELKGSFNSEARLGLVFINSEMGVFGILDESALNMAPIPMATRHEIRPGPATVLSTISGNKPQEFEAVVERVNYSESENTKNMVVRITDERLIASTGGIVQGMSGSPIIQDGKLIGAITHVFVNDPTRGYSIFAENMDRTLRDVKSGSSAAA